MSLIRLTNTKEIWTFSQLAKKRGRYPKNEDASIIKGADLLVNAAGKIVYLGPARNIPARLRSQITKTLSAEGGYVLPGFIECHTHLTFVGSRSQELDLRNQGLTYQQITQRGGGIFSTVQQVRRATLSDLININQTHLQRFYEQGVVLVEAKSGYGLNYHSETKILKSLLKVSRPQTVIPTFLGAHSLPPEFTSWQKYLAYWLPYLPRIRSLASRLDIFIDAGFCPLELGKQFLKSAQKLGFMVTIHADQLTRQGATQLGVELGASSVDHVIHVTQKDIQQLSRSETVAVLLPIADLYLKCPYPPARALIDAGACVALSTDFNPGTAPSQSLGLVGLLARLEMKMTLIEVLNGFTVGAAQALRRLDTLGSLEIGKCAHWQIYSHHPFDLFYSADPLRPTQVFIAGQRII